MSSAIPVKSLKSALTYFRADLEALPDEAMDRALGGKARTVADLVHEVNMVNDHVVLAMKGEPTPDWPDGWVRAPEHLRSKAALLEAFDQSSRNALEVAESFSPEELTASMQTENGETTRLNRIQFMAAHTWYHSGQLNFIQTLLGDDAMHWS
jgi:uncharacterized damage-inducible protein DinB